MLVLSKGRNFWSQWHWSHIKSRPASKSLNFCLFVELTTLLHPLLLQSPVCPASCLSQQFLPMTLSHNPFLLHTTQHTHTHTHSTRKKDKRGNDWKSLRCINQNVRTTDRNYTNNHTDTKDTHTRMHIIYTTVTHSVSVFLSRSCTHADILSLPLSGNTQNPHTQTPALSLCLTRTLLHTQAASVSMSDGCSLCLSITAERLQTGEQADTWAGLYLHSPTPLAVSFSSLLNYQHPPSTHTHTHTHTHIYNDLLLLH